jgi:hypothetical protein
MDRECNIAKMMLVLHLIWEKTNKMHVYIHFFDVAWIESVILLK